MDIKGIDGETYDVPDAAYEAIVAEKEEELNRVVAANKAAATRAKNERDKLAEDLEALRNQPKQTVDTETLQAIEGDLYAAWWSNDREGIQLAIRALKAEIKRLTS